MKHACVFMWLFLSAIGTARASDAVVIGVKNSATVCKVGGTCKAVCFGGKVAEGDTILTAEDARVEIRFNSGSTVTVEPSSMMVLASAKKENKKVTAKWGQFNFKVKSRDSKSKFKVETPVAVAGAEGTIFNIGVRKENGDTRVALLAGKLRVTCLFGEKRTLMLEPDHFVWLSERAPVPKPKRIPSDQIGKLERKAAGLERDAGAELEGEDEKAEDTEIPMMKMDDEADDGSIDAAAPSEQESSIERLYQSGQNASAGFISQESQEQKEEIYTPSQQAKDKSKVIIKITNE